MASEVTLDSLPPPVPVDHDIARLLSLRPPDARSMEPDPYPMEPTYQRAPQENQVPMPPAWIHRSTQTTTPPALERLNLLYLDHRLDFDEDPDKEAGGKAGGEAGGAAGTEAGKEVMFGRHLPTTRKDLGLGSSKYYCAPNGDMLPIPSDFIPWSVLVHYITGTGSKARIDLPLYKRAAPIRFILGCRAALLFLISVFTGTAFAFQIVHQLEWWVPQVAYYFILFGSGFLAH